MFDAISLLHLSFLSEWTSGGHVWGGGRYAQSAKPSRLQHEAQDGGLFAKVQPTLSPFILRTCTTTSCHAYGGGGAASLVFPIPHPTKTAIRKRTFKQAAVDVDGGAMLLLLLLLHVPQTASKPVLTGGGSLPSARPSRSARPDE